MRHLPTDMLLCVMGYVNNFRLFLAFAQCSKECWAYAKQIYRFQPGHFAKMDPRRQEYLKCVLSYQIYPWKTLCSIMIDKCEYCRHKGAKVNIDWNMNIHDYPDCYSRLTMSAADVWNLYRVDTRLLTIDSQYKILISELERLISPETLTERANKVQAEKDQQTNEVLRKRKVSSCFMGQVLNAREIDQRRHKRLRQTIERDQRIRDEVKLRSIVRRHNLNIHPFLLNWFIEYYFSQRIRRGEQYLFICLRKLAEYTTHIKLILPQFNDIVSQLYQFSTSNSEHLYVIGDHSKMLRFIRNLERNIVNTPSGFIIRQPHTLVLF